MNNYERQKQQAYQHLILLEKELKLNSIMSENFLQGDVFYCVHSPDLSVSMILKVAQSNEIDALVSAFERRFLAKVYLCIVMEDSIAMLYVGPRENEWRTPDIKNGAAIVCAAVHNLQDKIIEFRDIILTGITGAPIRIG